MTTPEAVVQILCSENESRENIYIVGITEPWGNWYFLKHEMEFLDRHIKKNLYRTDSMARANPSVDLNVFDSTALV